MIKTKSYKISSNNFLMALIASALIGVAISYSDFYLFHFILSMLTIIWIYQIRENKYLLDFSLFSKKYVPTLIVFFIWYLISVLWAPSLELGFKYIFYISCGLILTLSIVSFSSSIHKLNKLFYLLSGFIIIEIIIALIESFSRFRMPISSYSALAPLFGKDPVNFSKFDNILLYSNFSPPTGFHWNTNDLAICMIIALPFFLCSKKTSIKVFGILSITTIVAMTASRAVFLALILIYSFYLFFVKKQVGTLSLILMTTMAILWGMTQFRESDNPRINELANSIDALTLYLSGEIDVAGSLQWRRELVENGLNAFASTYGLGLGAGGSVANQELVGPVAGRFTSMHNFWVELLVEGGIFIGIITLFWLLSIIYKLFTISRINNDYNLKYYSQALFLSLIGFIPAAISASSTIYFFPMWIMFGFAISVISLSKIKPD